MYISLGLKKIWILILHLTFNEALNVIQYFPSLMVNIYEATVMQFYLRLTIMSSTTNMGKWEDSRKMGTTMILRHTIRNVQLKFLVDVIKIEVLDNLALTGYSEGNRSRGEAKSNLLPVHV